MKKIISILALVLALTALMSVSAFAEKEFALADSAVLPEGVTVTPAADSIAVTVPATAGADYSILLVDGSALPTSETGIAYINQAQADGETVAFNVLPKLGSCGDDCTIYIGSNAEGADLISIPVTYLEQVTGPNVTFMNGAETVATLTAVDGAVVAPAGSANVPTPGEGALISSYEFVGWTDADGETTYEVGDSIPVTEEMTLYAKYIMYNLEENVVKHGDIDGDGRLRNGDIDELALYFDVPEDCAYAEWINVPYDELCDAKYGDIDGDGRLRNGDIDELALYFDVPEDCSYADVINTEVFFINY